MLCPEELVMAVSAAAISISKSLSAASTALVGAVFTQLGDTLSTIAAAKDKMEQLSENDKPQQPAQTSVSDKTQQPEQASVSDKPD